jgi:hypothetical protein
MSSAAVRDLFASDSESDAGEVDAQQSPRKPTPVSTKGLFDSDSEDDTADDEQTTSQDKNDIIDNLRAENQRLGAELRQQKR